MRSRFNEVVCDATRCVSPSLRLDLADLTGVAQGPLGFSSGGVSKTRLEFSGVVVQKSASLPPRVRHADF